MSSEKSLQSIPLASISEAPPSRGGVEQFDKSGFLED